MPLHVIMKPTKILNENIMVPWSCNFDLLVVVTTLCTIKYHEHNIVRLPFVRIRHEYLLIMIFQSTDCMATSWSNIFIMLLYVNVALETFTKYPLFWQTELNNGKYYASFVYSVKRYSHKIIYGSNRSHTIDLVFSFPA